MSSSVSFLEARVLTHSTENIEKVMEAFTQLITPEVLDEVKPVQQRLEGHYKNSITLIKVRLNKMKQIKTAIQNLFSRLDETQRRTLQSELDKQVDEDGSLYLRFSKQEAFMGRIKLGRVDPIRVRMKLYIPRKQREKILVTYRKMIP